MCKVKSGFLRFFIASSSPSSSSSSSSSFFLLSPLPLAICLKRILLTCDFSCLSIRLSHSFLRLCVYFDVQGCKWYSRLEWLKRREKAKDRPTALTPDKREKGKGRKRERGLRVWIIDQRQGELATGTGDDRVSPNVRLAKRVEWVEGRERERERVTQSVKGWTKLLQVAAVVWMGAKNNRAQARIAMREEQREKGKGKGREKEKRVAKG